MMRRRIDRMQGRVAARAPVPPDEVVEVHLPYNGRGAPYPGVYDIVPGRSRLVILAVGPDGQPADEPSHPIFSESSP